MHLLLSIPLGLLIGAVLGLVGAGGSIIAVPALVYCVGLSPNEAIPASLIVVGLAALTAVVPRLKKQIDWRSALIVGVAGIPAAWGGAAVNRLLNPSVLLLAFAALMVVSAWRMLTVAGGRSTRAMPSLRRHLPKALAVGVAVGFLTGLLGIGGGFIITPALVVLLGLPMSRAIGTSLVIIVINSTAGVTAHLTDTGLDWPIVLTFAAAAIGGSLLAARFGMRLPDRIVAVTFALLILVVAAFVAVQSVVALAA